MTFTYPDWVLELLMKQYGYTKKEAYQHFVSYTSTEQGKMELRAVYLKHGKTINEVRAINL